MYDPSSVAGFRLAQGQAAPPRPCRTYGRRALGGEVSIDGPVEERGGFGCPIFWRFTRQLELLEGARGEGAEVWLRGAATYRAEGLPDFVLVLEETLRFQAVRIVHLEDRYSAEMIAETERFVREVGPKIGLELNRGRSVEGFASG